MIFPLLSLLLAACSSASAPATAYPTPRPLSLVSVQVGIAPGLIPFESDEEGQAPLSGFDIDLMNAIAQNADLEVNYVVVRSGRPQMVNMTAQCKVDVGISAVPLMENANPGALFSDVYFSTRQVLVVKKGNLTIQGRSDLNGMIVAAEKGVPAESELDALNGARTRRYETSYLLFQDLINGYIDAAIADAPHALQYVNVKPNNLKIVGEAFGSTQYALVVCPQRPELLQRINQALAALKADGSLAALLEKWKLQTTP
ncbi:MAG: basic amino acid ABC transporter substrate-binding protein [Anaerolineales bacterium]